MKKIIFLFCLALLSFSCAEKGKFTIVGTTSFAELEGKNVYLVKYNLDGVEKVDTTLINGGKFSFQGIQEKQQLYYLLVDNESLMKKRMILLEPGQLFVKIEKQVSVTGTPANDAFQKFLDEQLPLIEKMAVIDEKYEKLLKDSALTTDAEKALDEEYNVPFDQQKELYTKYLSENLNNALGQELFKNVGRRLNEKQLETVLTSADSTFKASELGINSLQRLEAMKNTVPGKPFTDVKSKTPEGKDISLSEFAGKGKYVLIDFWASWCGPCRREMPVLVEAYNLYKNKNFEIVGISLDEDAEAWKNGIANLKITWPQMSELNRFQAEAVKLYAVQGIPHTILLDPNGIILEKNLRGRELLNKLKEILK